MFLEEDLAHLMKKISEGNRAPLAQPRSQIPPKPLLQKRRDMENILPGSTIAMFRFRVRSHNY